MLPVQDPADQHEVRACIEAIIDILLSLCLTNSDRIGYTRPYYYPTLPYSPLATPALSRLVLSSLSLSFFSFFPAVLLIGCLTSVLPRHIPECQHNYTSPADVYSRTHTTDNVLSALLSAVFHVLHPRGVAAPGLDPPDRQLSSRTKEPKGTYKGTPSNEAHYKSQHTHKSAIEIPRPKSHQLREWTTCSIVFYHSHNQELDMLHTDQSIGCVRRSSSAANVPGDDARHDVRFSLRTYTDDP
ncbi:hypothetical protein EW146_g10116 [Bondarzewia mesenterica]|uniref:Uncharacterized protein n=1 Tax=Bondarzewia mesenterica TaxID=1095465 RepID=A0A4S4L0W2_9AGAM|nr:hypothetical protein EW146_g10116 [Bondarzewia mesenterica]